MILCPICKRPMDPNICGCTNCSSPDAITPKSPEAIMRDAIIAVACATLRQNKVPDTFVAERAHEKLPYFTLEELNLVCLNLVRKALGYPDLGIVNYDGGNVLERLR